MLFHNAKFFRALFGHITFVIYKINKMQRIAIPVINGKLSEFFGECNHYELFEITDGEIKRRDLQVPPKMLLEKLPDWASNKGITDILTYKIDKHIIMLFNKHKINLFIGVPINSPEILIEEFIAEKIESNQKIITEIIEN